MNSAACYFPVVYRRGPEWIHASRVSEPHRPAASQRFHRRVGEDQGAQPVRAAGRRCRLAGHRGDELVELASISLLIALEEKMQRLGADDAFVAGEFDRA